MWGFTELRTVPRGGYAVPPPIPSRTTATQTRRVVRVRRARGEWGWGWKAVAESRAGGGGVDPGDGKDLRLTASLPAAPPPPISFEPRRTQTTGGCRAGYRGWRAPRVCVAEAGTGLLVEEAGSHHPNDIVLSTLYVSVLTFPTRLFPVARALWPWHALPRERGNENKRPSGAVRVMHVRGRVQCVCVRGCARTDARTPAPRSDAVSSSSSHCGLYNLKS